MIELSLGFTVIESFLGFSVIGYYKRSSVILVLFESSVIGFSSGSSLIDSSAHQCSFSGMPLFFIKTFYYLFVKSRYSVLNYIFKKKFTLNPIQDGPFRAWSWMREEAKRPPLPKICHTYLTIMKIGAVIHYLKKIQKTYEFRGIPLEFY